MYRHSDGNEVDFIISTVIYVSRKWASQQSVLNFFDNNGRKIPIPSSSNLYSLSGKNVGTILHERQQIPNDCVLFVMVLRKMNLGICPKFRLESPIIKRWACLFSDLLVIQQQILRETCVEADPLNSQFVQIFHSIRQTSPIPPQISQLFQFIKTYSPCLLSLSTTQSINGTEEIEICGTTNLQLLKSLGVHPFPQRGICYWKAQILSLAVEFTWCSDQDFSSKIKDNVNLRTQSDISFWISNTDYHNMSLHGISTLSIQPYPVFDVRKQKNSVVYLGLYVTKSCKGKGERCHIEAKKYVSKD